MNQTTTALFTTITGALAQNYGVKSVTRQFNVEPTIEQRLYDQVYQSAAFLERIDTQFVDDLVGQGVTMGIDGSVTGRAGVESDNTKERQTKDPAGLNAREYRCYPTECDVHITWNQMDTWSKFPDFVKRWRNHVRQVIALDILKVGWNGTSAAPVTDIGANPLLQDVNIGWLQLTRRDAPARAISDGEQQVGEIRIGAGGDYENLDQAVHDLKQGIPSHKRVGLVAIIGEDLTANDKSKLYAKQAHTPSEKGKIELSQIIDTYGGLPSYTVPFFPARGILVTSFENLAFYIQSGSIRMSTVTNDKKKRVEDYQSRNDCFYINDLEKIVFFESASVKLTKVKDPAVADVDFDPDNPAHWLWS